MVMAYIVEKEVNHNKIYIKGDLPTVDKRDPDTHFPLIMGVRVVEGTLEANQDDSITLSANHEGRLIVAWSIEILDIDKDKIDEQLDKAVDIRESVESCKHWFNGNLGHVITLKGGDDDLLLVKAKSIYTLLSNSALSPGYLKGRVSAFPSRGEYPVHYLWDSVFQNLAVNKMNKRLAEDSLLILLENLRTDGKMPMFCCSTWMRPHESQPPLVGWSALSLIKERNDLSFAKKVLAPLIKNTQWWLTQRRSPTGLIFAQHGLETGWDNSPRFDDGPTVSCDMNSYLLMQIRSIAEIARLLGVDEIDGEYTQMANDFADLMVKHLYDETTVTSGTSISRAVNG